MKNFLRWMGPLALLTISVLGNWEITEMGQGLLNADHAIGPLTAEKIRQGEFLPFQLHGNYGGSYPAILRAAWVETFVFFRGIENTIQAHLIFNTIITPFLFSLATAFLLSSFLSLNVTYLIAALVAFGFNFWYDYVGFDFYFFYLVAGSVLLGWRIRMGGSPLTHAKPTSLFFFALLSGASIYICRASLIYVLTTWIDPQWAYKEAKSFLRKKRSTPKKVFLSIAYGLLLLFVYLEIFGSDFFSWGEKTVRLHATPNLKYALTIILGIWALEQRRVLFQFNRRILIATLGALAGLAPELLFVLKGGEAYSTAANGFAGMMTALGSGPTSFKELVLANHSLPSVLVFFVWIAAFFNVFKDSKRLTKTPFSLLVFGLLLTGFAYIRVRTYISAPPRYLLPILPFAFMVIGIYFESILTKVNRDKKLLRTVPILLLLSLHLFTHWQQKKQRTIQVMQSHRIEHQSQIINLFRQENLKVVLSDNYWYTNQFSLIAGENPVFASPYTYAYVPRQAYHLAANQSKVGILLSEEVQKGRFPKRLIRLRGSDWKLTPLSAIGKHRIYIGERIQ